MSVSPAPLPRVLTEAEAYKLFPCKDLRVAHMVPVGSRVTVDPIPEGADHDWLVLVEKEPSGNVLMDSDDYKLEGFTCIQVHDIDYIVTHNQDFFNKWLLGTHVAKGLNLHKKDDRILLFQAILYGNAWGKPTEDEYDPFAD